MDKKKNYTVCNIKLDKDNYQKDRTVFKDCYHKKKRKSSNRTLIQNTHHTSFGNDISTSHQQSKIDNINNNNRTLIIGFSNCGDTYLMNCILLQKQEPVFINTKSLNQYPSIEAQTSDEIEFLDVLEISTFVFDDMLQSKQASNTNLFFKERGHKNIDIYYISQCYFLLPKNTIRNNSNIFILFIQTLGDIILLFFDSAGLNMNHEKWKQLCHNARGSFYIYLKLYSNSSVCTLYTPLVLDIVMFLTVEHSSLYKYSIVYPYPDPLEIKSELTSVIDKKRAMSTL